jgi:hypothetical protein
MSDRVLSSIILYEVNPADIYNTDLLNILKTVQRLQKPYLWHHQKMHYRFNHNRRSLAIKKTPLAPGGV